MKRELHPAATVGRLVPAAEVQVRVRWGDYVIGVWFLALDRDFVIGAGTNVDCAVCLGVGMPQAVRLRLDRKQVASGDEVEQRVGPIDVSLRAVPAGPRRWAPRFDQRDLLGALAFAIAIVATTFAAYASTPPPAIPLVRMDPRWLRVATIRTFPLESTISSSERARAESEGAFQGELNRCEQVPGGTNGAPESRTPAVDAVAGPDDNADPHLARETGRQTYVPASTYGAAPNAAPRAIAMAWGRNDALGRDDQHARGADFQKRADEGSGSEARGWSGNCAGCGTGGLVETVAKRGSDNDCAVAIGFVGRRVPR